ncbi:MULTISPECIES: GntR family transcriptional regulator [unclassified Phyllobacterium]|uniref:GntR family transcriptional regulator n=1 Tax=unclassified Phyllobacterium TaxID=2638441 RepID=UPI003012E2DA
MEKVRTRRSDEVAELIAKDIRSGTLSTGTWLKQADVEQRYRASRADIRRALEILLQRRLVEQIPERGFYVPMPDQRRQRELREIRVTLETSMAESVVANRDTAKLKALHEAAQRFEEAIEKGGIAERYETNQVFHVALANFCSNQELIKLVIDLRGYVPASPMSQWPDMARARKSAREHFEIIEAIARGDIADLKRLLSIHILQPD